MPRLIDIGGGVMIDADEQMLALERFDYENSLYDFLVGAWPFLDASPWKDGWPIEAVAEHLQAVVDGDIKRLVINIPPRMGKACENNTLVMTTRGWKAHGDLVPGDFVFHPSGKPIKVLATNDDVPTDARVEFFDGSVFYCHENHEWTLYNRMSRRWETVETRVFLEPRRGRWGRTGKTAKKASSGGRALHQLSAVEALDMPEISLPMPPYVLGAWLGDGSTGAPYITHDRKDGAIVEAIEALGFARTEEIVHPTTGVITSRFSGEKVGKTSRFSAGLIEAGVYKDKHVPEVYKLSSINQRLALLAGLIDTDGTVDKASRCHFTSGNEKLAHDVAEIVRSLGWRATIQKYEPRLSTSGIQGKNPYWTISFQPTMVIPTVLPRKQIKRLAPKRAIGLKSVTLDPQGLVGHCIEVDSPDGLYLIGRNLIPTHNSSITSVAFPAWTWAQSQRSATSGPGVQFLCASYGSSLAMRDSVKCRRLIESPWYQKYWGGRFKLTSDQNTKGRFLNDQRGERLITSVDAKITGEGGSIIIVDDPNAANEAFSEANIQSTIDWWDGTMSTRLNDQKTGAMIVIQQRLAENDLTGHILDNDTEREWTHLCLPMRYESSRHTSTIIGWEDPRGCDLEGEPLVKITENGVREPRDIAAEKILKVREGSLLWDDRFGEKEVARLERILGPYGAAGQLQQRPEPAGGGLIKTEWWNLWEGRAYPAMDYIMASLDTAYTLNTANDCSAMTIWGIFSEDFRAQEIRSYAKNGKQVVERMYVEGAPKLMLMHAWNVRLEFHELIEKVAHTCKQLKVDKLLIENKAAGISVAQEMRRLYSGQGWAVQLSDPKSSDKYSRLISIQHLFAEGLVFAPDTEWAQEVVNQVGSFPKGKHDDLVDTVSMAVRHLRDLGMLTRSSERADELDALKVYPGKGPQPLYPV